MPHLSRPPKCSVSFIWRSSETCSGVFSLLRSTATVTFELLHDFCNGVRYGFIVLNPINSDARAVFFNSEEEETKAPLPSPALLKSFSPLLETVVTYELDGSLFRHEIGVSGTGAGSGEKEPERTKVKKLAVYGNLIFGGFDTAHAPARARIGISGKTIDEISIANRSWP
ncbi:hypothetical protein F2Q70_00020066 [Brassica cretica]|uniref:Uncharacterized protein n=1 Tax=Brassica cretica TaxID=69181 RepID=A0A8S9GS00_BRACR|nr:hypothetical protein F2Q70_00020066 [Brassica cretica]